MEPLVAVGGAVMFVAIVAHVIHKALKTRKKKKAAKKAAKQRASATPHDFQEAYTSRRRHHL
jgi:hypothetical protein